MIKYPSSIFCLHPYRLFTSFSFVFRIVIKKKKFAKRKYLGTEKYNHNVSIYNLTGSII